MSWAYWSKKKSVTSLLPNQVANLSIWYDVSDLSTITKDGGTGAVSQLDDKSGNTHNLSQATSGMQPIWTPDQFKGFNVIRFTAANSHHLLTAIDTVTANDFFAVIKPNPSGPNGGTMYSNIGGGTNSYHSVAWMSVEQSLRVNLQASSANLILDNTIIDLEGGTIFNNYYKSFENLYLNSSQKTDFISVGIAQPGNRTFSLGRLRLSSSPVYGSFDFLELFAYTSVVSDQDRIKLWQYLSDKYSLTKPEL